MATVWNPAHPLRSPERHRNGPRLAGCAALALLVLTGCGVSPDDGASPQSTVTATATDTAQASPTPSTSTSSSPTGVSVVASNLAVPWGVAFLPDGTAVVTERDSGRVLLLSRDQESDTDSRRVVVAGRLEAQVSSESGLLGVAVSPSFEADRTLYFYLTSASDNRVVKATLEGTRLGAPEPILTGIPSNVFHDGGRMVFGPDGHLYVSTGDAGDRELAQDKDSLAGKILRITREGKAAPGNPWDSPVWSRGHRNVQGLAFDADQRLWASEFGESTWDELNLIVAGGNYGWPAMEGNEGRNDAGFTAPQAVWNPGENSPSGLAHRAGTLWLGALRGARLWSAEQDSDTGIASTQDHFVGELGRIRTVVTTPEGDLWITTSNRDGRGTPGPADDRILRVRFE